MESVRQTKRETERIVKHLVEYAGIDRKLARNSLEYARCLVDPNTGVITDNVFKAQMSKVFGIDSFLMEFMISVVRKLVVPEGKSIGVEEYTKLLCIFFTKDHAIKANYVFDVYDFNDDNQIDYKEGCYLLRNLLKNEAAADELELMADVQDFCDLCFSISDFDGNKVIDREEYRNLVQQNVMLLQIFGDCMPTDEKIKNFAEFLMSKTVPEIQKEFRYERLICVNSYQARIETYSKHYPIHLNIE